MFKRAYRLGRATKNAYTQSFTHPLFSLRVRKNNIPHNRFGFIVSKRIDKRAVVRNRIKRIFRSCIEDICDKMPVGYDMLFVLKKAIANTKRDEMSLIFISFLKSKGFYNEKNS